MSMKLSFGDIPQELQAMKKDIKNITLQKLYSNFHFHYLSLSINEKIDNNSIKTFSLQYLNEFKFLTYQISNSQLISISKETNLLNKNNVIICVEKKCLIIDSIDSDLISGILNEVESSKIEIIKEEIAAFEDVTSFCNNFQIHINKNLFVKSTIFPVASFIIRRFYYPSNFFKDQTFFMFDAKTNTIEQNFKTNFENIISSKNNDEFRANFPKFAKYIHDEKNLQKLCNSNKNNYEFKEEDFIVLRFMYSGKNIIKLVIHVEKFYLFVIKTLSQQHDEDEHLQKHEIDFCEKYSHRCLTRFYGFLKKQNHIIGFVYEFMSNGQLSDFISKNKEKVNNLFSFVALNRIFQGINYMHSNSIIYRDLKPSNILIDHNYNVFIADFDCVRNAESNEEFTNDIGSAYYISPEQKKDGNIDFSTDIFSFGLVIYLLFEKKYINSKKSPMFRNAPKQIQNLISECIQIDPNKRITRKYILKNLFAQMKSFEYLEDFLLNENDQKKLTPLIIRYFLENIICLYQNKKIINVKIHTYYIFCFLDVLIQEDNSETIFKLGKLYELGGIVGKDYMKAKTYYELAIEKNNNMHAILCLGILYFDGKGVEKNQFTAYEYYKLAADKKNWNGLYLMGKCHALGEGAEKDIAKAQHFFQLTDECKNSLAYYSLGMLYYEGKLIEKDYEKAKYYFKLSAEKNDSNGHIMLGNMYNEGNGVIQNYKEAIKYFKLSAKYGFLGAYHNIGNYYYNIKNSYKKAKNYYELASQHYLPQSLFMLAFIFYFNIKNILKFKEYIKLALLTDFAPSYYLYGIYCNKKDENKAIRYFEIGDKRNDGDAQNMLGCIYRDGQGVSQDYIKAKELFEKSMSNGSLEGIINLGELYFNGSGIKQDFVKAEEIFKIAALRKKSLGYVYLGHFYYEGLTGEKNYDKAKEYYELAAQQKDSYAYINLAKIYFTGNGAPKDIRKAINYLKKSAKSGNWIALQNLGILYFNGYFYIKKDEKKALECFEKSIEDNDSEALLSLGILYYEGKSIKIEGKGYEYYQKAIQYFESSAAQNNSFALLNLAKIYIEGKYEKPDYAKSFSYINKSINQSNYYAYIYLGDFYLEGKVVEQSYSKAIEYYEKAASQNISEAFLNLGLLYYQGKGVDKDYNKAIQYFELSASQKSSEALFKLGKIYYEGKEIERNYKKSLEYFSLSSEKDNLDSYFYIGKIYEKGQGVDIDILKAIQCYQKCIEIHDNNIFFIMKDYNLITYKSQIYYNYYRSTNDLGLIYATEMNYQNIQLADKYLKEAFLGEYPLGQNNHGLLCQFYFNRINDAEYKYKRASEHNLVFAEYNLGYLKEKEKKLNEMIQHYTLASEYENEVFRFRNQIIDDDEQLEISKSFIVFISNLKLVQYYLTQKETETNKEKTENYLMKAIFQPLFRLLFQQNNSESYSFQFDFDKSNKILTNLKEFFFKCPLFFKSNDNSNWVINARHNDIKSITIYIQSNKENKENPKVKYNAFENSNRDISFFKEKIKYILNLMNNEGKIEIIDTDDDSNEIKFKFKNDDVLRFLKFPRNLYEKIFQDIPCIKKEIDEVIEEGMKILYQPPYNILFGRIKNRQCFESDIRPIRKDINESFYAGFE